MKSKGKADGRQSARFGAAVARTSRRAGVETRLLTPGPTHRKIAGVNVDRYRHFTAQIVTRLQTEPEVLGIVALGSTADAPERAPDSHSDHDLWIVTEPGAQERFRASLDWLPEADRIIFSFRETEHGLKVVYDDAHLIEVAVVGRDELHVARANVYRVLADSADVAQQLEACVRATRGRPKPELAWLHGQAVTHLLVGMERWSRGERLSGHRFVRELAVERLLDLVAGVSGTDSPTSGADDLDPFRRIEARHPELSREVEQAVASPLPTAAAALLQLLVELPLPEGVRTPSARRVEAVVRERIAALAADAHSSSAGAS